MILHLVDSLVMRARGLSSTYGPTGQHKQSLDIASSMLDKLYVELDAISSRLPNLRVELNKMNAPLIIWCK